jgi:hypothetical protein
LRTGKGTAVLRKKLSICILAAITIFSIAGQSFAGRFGINITVWDKMGSQPPTGSSGEDNEVEPGDVLAQQWDLEGFYLSGNSLTMIGGFNFLTGGYAGGNTWYQSGDIFISTNPGSVLYGNPPASNLNNIQNQPNIFGYNYVLDMDYATQTYQVYGIGQSALLSDVYYQQNAGSNPYRYVSGGTAIGGIQSFQYSSSPDLTGLNLQGMGGDNFHNSLTVNLGFLPENTDFLAHFTEQCGNDALVGSGHTTPEPTSIALVGGGLLILLGYRRFKPAK